MSVIVDTHKVHTRLIEAGFEKEKADVIVEVFSRLEDEVATKGDITLLRKDMEIMKKELMIQMWSVGTVIVGILGAINFFT